MSFKTTLFQALLAADFTTCNGQSVVSKFLDTSPEALLKPYVDLANETTIYIQDIEIVVDDDGRAYGTAKDDATEPLVWTFRVIRPLAQSDVTTIPPPALKVTEVLDRLRQIERKGRRDA